MIELRDPLTGHARLQQPFPPSQIQQLPQGGTKLDYVSHGNVTKRLLEVDENWNWEPLAFDERGLPLFDEHGGLWIKLTVLGVTRLGYGEPQGRDDYDKTKGAIGNAIRTAAMRFGVALDLWAREVPTTNPEPRTQAWPKTQTGTGRAFSADPATPAQIKLINTLTAGDTTIVETWKSQKGIDRALTKLEASQLIEELKNPEPATTPVLDAWGLPIE